MEENEYMQPALIPSDFRLLGKPSSRDQVNCQLETTFGWHSPSHRIASPGECTRQALASERSAQLFVSCLLPESRVHFTMVSSCARFPLSVAGHLHKRVQAFWFCCLDSGANPNVAEKQPIGIRINRLSTV